MIREVISIKNIPPIFSYFLVEVEVDGNYVMRGESHISDIEI
jgi:hypothetical protein